MIKCLKSEATKAKLNKKNTFNEDLEITRTSLSQMSNITFGIKPENLPAANERAVVKKS